MTLLRRHNASSTFTLDLRGPLDQPKYAVSWAESYVAEKHQVLTAAELRRLKVSIAAASSVVVRYTPLHSPTPPSPPPPSPPPSPPPPPPAPPPAPPPSPSGKVIVFGDAALNVSLDAKSLSLVNITAVQGQRRQGFVLRPFSLWQLNATDCSEYLPHGMQVDGQSECSSREHRIVVTNTGRTLVLQWFGVNGLPGGSQVDVLTPPDNAVVLVSHTQPLTQFNTGASECGTRMTASQMHRWM